MTTFQIPTYSPLKNEEWQIVVGLTKKNWEKNDLKRRPTRRDASRQLEGRINITLLQWAAFIALIVIAVFTTVKTFAATVPIAEIQVRALLGGTSLAAWIEPIYIVLAGLTSAMLSTPALIYFKVIDSNDRRFKNKPALIVTNHKAGILRGVIATIGNLVSLNKISYYLPALLVYGIAIYLFYVSLHGDYVNGLDRLILILVVLAEIALAYLVSDLLEQIEARAGLVTSKLRGMRTEWESRRANMWNDEAFLTALYQNILDAVIHVKRDGRDQRGQRFTKRQVNLFVEALDGATREAVVMAEYSRHARGSRAFAGLVTGNQAAVTEAAAALVKPTAKRTTIPAAPVTAANPVSTTLQHTLVLPPQAGWTVESLAEHMATTGTIGHIVDHRGAQSPYHAVSAWYSGVPNSMKNPAIERAKRLRGIT